MAAYVLCFWMYSANGMAHHALAHGRMMVISSQLMRYRRPLAPFAAYEITTHVCYYDAAAMYVAHEVRCATTGRVMAESVARFLFRGQNRTTVAPAQVLQEMAIDMPAPPAVVPDLVQCILQMEKTESTQTTTSKSHPSRIALQPPAAQQEFEPQWPRGLRALA